MSEHERVNWILEQLNGELAKAPEYQKPGLVRAINLINGVASAMNEHEDEDEPDRACHYCGDDSCDCDLI